MDTRIVEVDTQTHLKCCVEVFAAAFAAEPWNEVWPETKVRRRLTEIMITPGSLGLAAFAGEECLGFLAGYVESFHPNDRFQLAEMAVRPEHQRAGVGTALVRALLHRLAAAHVDEVFLITARGQSPEGFWKSQSFALSPGRTVMAYRHSRR